MMKLLILADDFTGGLDTGVQFAARGISTCVITNPDADYAAEAGASDVLVVVAETRHLPPKDAYRAVFSAVRKGVEAGIPYIYKKTDSALRGNIGAELTAVLKASGEKLLPFIPALPAMNRVTRGGIHYIDGVPVTESVFGRDPFEPVVESDVVRLIASQSAVPAKSLRADEPAGEPLSGLEGIAVLDAGSDTDLVRAGQAAEKANGLRISAGCAGFASVLPDLLKLAGNKKPEIPRLDKGLFVLCGSVNPITQRQLDYGEKHGFERIHIPPEEKLHPERFPDGDGKATLDQWKQRIAENPWLILDANDTDPSNRETAEQARQEGLTTEDIRQRISESLGRILSAAAEVPAERTMLITGGDTLLQGMNRMQVYRMFPLAEVAPGVVLSRVTLHGRERLAMTKSGGFGSETLLADLKAIIEKQA